MQIRAALRARSRALRFPMKSQIISLQHISEIVKIPKRSGVTAVFKTANAIALTLPSTSTSSGLSPRVIIRSVQSFQSDVPMSSNCSRFNIFTTIMNGLLLRSLSSLKITLGARRGLVEALTADKIVCKLQAKSEVEEFGD